MEAVKRGGHTHVVVHLAVAGVRLLEAFVDRHWKHQLPLGQEGVDLLDEFEGCVLLVEDQRINVVDGNWDFSFEEEAL